MPDAAGPHRHPVTREQAHAALARYHDGPRPLGAVGCVDLVVVELRRRGLLVDGWEAALDDGMDVNWDDPPYALSQRGRRVLAWLEAREMRRVAGRPFYEWPRRGPEDPTP